MTKQDVDAGSGLSYRRSPPSSLAAVNDMSFSRRARDFVRQLFSIAEWLPAYSPADLRTDLSAGITVGVMLIPQGMAYAMLAGVPPIFGLYASLVPLLVYPIFGTSRHLAVGITAIDSLIIVAGVGALAAPMTDRFVGLALLLALQVGILQALMGLFRLGFVVKLLSRPVIAGFTAAAAIMIAFAQLENLLGLSLPDTSYVHILLWNALYQLGDVHLMTFGIGTAGIVLMAALKRTLPHVPGTLVVVIFATVAVWLFEWQAAGVAVVGEIPRGLPHFRLPDVDAATLRGLLPTAVTLALVQFMSVISLGKVFAARHNYTVDANRELVAMGAFNVAGGLFGSIPVSGSFSRSAVGELAGGRTALMNVFAAFVVGLTLLFLTPLFYYLPIPVFASIIIVAVAGMVDVAELRFLLRAKRVDGLIAVSTFASTLIIGIHQGVLIGIGASVVAILYRIGRPYVAELGHMPGTETFRDMRRYAEAVAYKGILILRIDASFSFANADFLRDLMLDRTRRDPSIRVVLIDASSINDLDTTAAATLRNVVDTLRARDVDLYFAGVKGPVRDTLQKCGLYDDLGPERFFMSPHRAVSSILEQLNGTAARLDAGPRAAAS